MIDLRLLSYLEAVSRLGTVTAAAESLHVAQPAISRQLRVLESSLGIKLFAREGRYLVLTPAGRDFAEKARKLLGQAEDLERYAKGLSQGTPSRMLIAASLQTINEVLAPALAAAPPEFNTTFDFLPCQPVEAPAMLDEGADLALGRPAANARFTSTLVGEIAVSVQFRDEELWRDRTSVDISELPEHTLILLTRNHLLRQRFDEELVRAGLQYRSMIESATPRGSQALAMRGKGLALLTLMPVYGLRSLPLTSGGEPLLAGVHASWERGHYARATIAEFVEVFRDYYRLLGEKHAGHFGR